MSSLQGAVESIAAHGRGGDTTVGHLTPGEIVIPLDVQSPELLKILDKHFKAKGKSTEKYKVGSGKNSINPHTGSSEFGVSTEKRIASDEKELNALTQAYGTPGDPKYQDPSTLASIQQIQGTLPGLEHKAKATTSFNDFFNSGVGQVLGDIGVAAAGYFGGPAGAAGAEGLDSALKGDSFGNSLENAGIAAAGSEIAPAAGNAFSSAFPETASSLGITGGANSLTDALGQTTGGASWTGPGTLGGALTSAYNGIAGGADSILGSGGSPTGATPTGGASPVQGVAPNTAAVGNAGTAGSGIGSPGGGSAPTGASVDPASTGQLGTDINNQIASLSNAGNIGQSVNNAGELSTVGSPASSTLSPGSPSVGGFNYNLSGNSVSPSLASASNAAAGGTGSPSGGILGSIVSGAEKNLTGNPLGVLASGAGLGLDALKGNNKKTGADINQQAIASQQQQQGQQLEGYLQSGTLPPGLQAGINQASDSAKAAIRSQYASMGLSGSSAEQEALSQIDIQAQAIGAQQAEQLLTQGINETGMASTIYNQLIQQQTQNDTNLSNAIGNFASAASGQPQVIDISMLRNLRAAGGAP